MVLLRRVLKIQAALWAVFGLVLVLLPGWLIDVLGQAPIAEGAWLRMLGVTAIVLAMLMWLVAGALETAWWWAWAFAVLEAGIATICLVNALFGVDAGVTAWPWWVLGASAAVSAALDLVALARTGQERPVV